MNRPTKLTAASQPHHELPPSGTPVRQEAGERVTCQECNGSGEVSFIALDSTRYEIGECPDCDGTGLVEAVCGICEGPLSSAGFCRDCDYPSGWELPDGWNRVEF